MRKVWHILQIAFTYMGTVVGAGFATGQEIVQFFTQYGRIGTFTIVLAAGLFIGLGSKLMLISHNIGAKSYEDMNRYLFGDRIGKWISFFTLIVLFGITAVMLAGAGSIFKENLHLHYQLGLMITLLLAYFIIVKGISAILAVNSVVVPVMLLFCGIIAAGAWATPTAHNWLQWTGNGARAEVVWLSPFLYVSFNLAMAQAVLVPLGSATRDRSVIYWGGIVGGAGIGLMLLASHFAISAYMPGIAQFDIPMASLIPHLGSTVQMLFVGVIFAEIFTTFIADIYGLTTQLQQHLPFSAKSLTLILLVFSFLISQIGFRPLLSTLYPLFGLASLFWFVMVFNRRTG